MSDEVELGPIPETSKAWAWGWFCGLVCGALLMLLCSPAHAGDLTAAEVRTLLAGAGVNPGTVRDLGSPHGRQALQSVTVARGKRRGEFVVRLVIMPVKQ